jgi:hypothetical protein
MRRRPGALFAPGLSLWIFSRDILFRLYRKVSYPSFTPHQAQGTYAIGRNLKNAPENIVRMGPGKIATHYNLG